jgi:hypothetical protein
MTVQPSATGFRISTASSKMLRRIRDDASYFKIVIPGACATHSVALQTRDPVQLKEALD